MTASGTKKLVDLLDDFPPEVARICRSVLAAELGKLHLQNPRFIRDEIREIIEIEAVRAERESESSR